MSEIINLENFSASSHQQKNVCFYDISLEIKRKKFCKEVAKKVILDSVSGVLLPGLNAIMGPTGSGKTSLLDVLADRKSLSRGTVLLDGENRPSNFKFLVGYVVQDDVVLGTLSVKENLYFSAALRLPRNTTAKQRKERVENVIDELGLQSCASTKIGNEFIRGVSGGERKRTNIGMELIIAPRILFLDEPTTGLDAYTAGSVVQLLKRLSEAEGRIIIMSIHQPRYSIFKLFDSLTLLSNGCVVYHGPLNKSLQYFKGIGYQCENHENPADFFLDIINKCEKENEVTNLSEVYKKSDEFKTVDAVVSHMLNGEKQNETTSGFKCIQSYSTNFLWQLLLISARSTVNLARNPGTSILQFITVGFFALVIGGIYFQLGVEAPGFQDRIGVFFFIAVNQAFGSLSAINLFIKERALFIHEYASGYYGVLPFFVAKIIVDIVFFRFLPNTLFALITFFMIGFQLEAARFFVYMLTIMLINVAAVSIAFCISALTRVAAVANLLIGIAFVVSMLFGGLLIALDSLPDWISWLRYLSFMRYGIEALSINEMDGLTFRCFQDISMFNQSLLLDQNCTFDGLTRLGELGYEVGWLWYDILALVAYAVFFLAVAYVILLLIKKEK